MRDLSVVCELTLPPSISATSRWRFSRSLIVISTVLASGTLAVYVGV